MIDTPPTGSTVGRIGTAVGGAALTGLAAWLAWLNLSRPTLDGWIFWVPVTLWLLTMGVLCWWSLLAGTVGSRAAIGASWRAGWMVGGIGLGIGFVGPLLLSDSNLGPLLGILMTGPLGFVLGAIGGAVARAAQGPNHTLS